MAGISVKLLSFQNALQNPSILGFTSNGLPGLGVLRVPCATQVREKKMYSHVNLIRPKYPLWLLKKEQIGRNDSFTDSNKLFVEEVIHDKFGPPAVISGVATYQLQTPLRTEVEPRGEWIMNKTRRTGLIGKKLGYHPLWDKKGNVIQTTLIQIVDNHVVKYTPPEEYVPKRVVRYREKNRYGCLLVGAESADPQKFTKEYCGLFSKAGLMPKKMLAQFMISPEAVIQPGTPLYANHWKVGDVVDVRGKTVFHGFQGVMMRWGFHGMPATHGQTKTHRKGGNTGGGGEKARTWPGTKMPGMMGGRWRRNAGCKILRINTKYNVLYLEGCSIPGDVGAYVYIYDTLLWEKRHTEKPAFPTFYPEDQQQALPEEIYHESLHPMSDTSILFKPEK